MVMDFVSGGELFSLLRKSQRFPDPVAKFFAAEVALALDYLHSLDIIYRCGGTSRVPARLADAPL